MLTITDAERAFYESVMEGVLADKPYSLSDLRLAYFLWRLDGGGGGGGGGDVASVNGKTGVVVLNAADVGLGNVDNTSDANKPVSTPQQTALNLKVSSSDGSVLDIQLKDDLAELPAVGAEGALYFIKRLP